MKLKVKPLSIIDKHIHDYKLHLLGDDNIKEVFKEYLLDKFLICATELYTSIELKRNIKLALTGLEGCLYSGIDKNDTRRILISLLFYKKSLTVMEFVNKAVLKLDNNKNAQGFDPESFIKLNKFLIFIKNKNNNVEPSSIEKTIIFEAIRMQSLLFISDTIVIFKEKYLSYLNTPLREKQKHSFKHFIENITYHKVINTTFTRWVKMKSFVLNFPEQKRILNEAINNLEREIKHDLISR